MRTKRLLCAVLGLVTAGSLVAPAAAAEVECDSIYCFSSGDFSTSEEEVIAGVCITGLPQPETGTVLLGTRVLREGDILTREQVEQLTFSPLRTEADVQAVVSYLPIYENRVEQTASLTLTVRGKEDKQPVARDSTMETYKNLPNEGILNANDPEGQKLTYTLIRKPKRGSVVINEDGSFVYTPKKNKVGVDSFTYTATDPAGKVSREATVTVQILKPTDSRQYSDTVGLDCRFEAEWLKNTGLFTGENISGQSCFQPEKVLSRGEFLAMTVKLLKIPTDSFDYSAIPADTPNWLKPYVAAALRAGLTAGWPDQDSFQTPITGAEAAVMLQNALDLTVSQEVLEQTLAETDVPVWAQTSLAALECNGVVFNYAQPLTRSDAALILYRISELALDAPGMAVLRMQS